MLLENVPDSVLPWLLLKCIAICVMAEIELMRFSLVVVVNHYTYLGNQFTACLKFTS